MFFVLGRAGLQVVRHGLITHHCGFQSTESLLPVRVLDLVEGDHYFLTLMGMVNISKLSPEKNSGDEMAPLTLPRYNASLDIYPDRAKPRTFPSTTIIIINAFRSAEPVTFALISPRLKLRLNYGESRNISVQLQEGDCINVRSGDSKFLGNF